MEDARLDSKRKTKLTSRLGWLFLVLLAIWIYTALSESPLIPSGMMAPSWELRVASAGNETLQLSDLKGKVVVLDFWSWGCPLCMKQAQVLETISRQMRSRGVVVLGVSAWGESYKEALAFKSKKRLSYPVLVGTQKMVQEYQVAGLPTLYLIDQNGRVASSHVGFWGRNDIAKAISKMLVDNK